MVHKVTNCDTIFVENERSQGMEVDATTHQPQVSKATTHVFQRLRHQLDEHVKN